MLIVSKESSLYREVKDNTMRATVAETKLHSSQNARFTSLVMVVTTVSNLIENGKVKEKSDDVLNTNSRNQSVEFNRYFYLTKRGREYINQFLGTKTHLDSTNYAIGLRVGSDMKKNKLYSVILNQFNSSLNTPTQTLLWPVYSIFYFP